MNNTTKKLLVNNTRTLNLYRLGNSRVISGFRREVDEICALLVY